MRETHCSHGVPFYGPPKQTECLHCDLVWCESALKSARQGLQKAETMVAEVKAKIAASKPSDAQGPRA